MTVDAKAAAVGAYWQSHPGGPPADSAPLEEVLAYEEALAAWRARFPGGRPPAPPAPPVIPPPASPGVGMQAARVGDLTAHGGAITGPGSTNVWIGDMPAARAMPGTGDQAACPIVDGVTAHVGGVIIKGSATVLVNDMQAARVSDPIQGPPPGPCAGNMIAMGQPNVLIGDLSAAGGAARAPARGGGRACADAPGGAGSGGSAAAAAPAETSPAAREPGAPVQVVGAGTHWIEFELLDEAERPVAAERFELRGPEHWVASGRLDPRGHVRLEGLPAPGSYTFSFPDLDRAAWRRRLAAPSAPAEPAAQTSPAGVESGQSSDPVRRVETAQRGGWRRAAAGECVSSIAADTGHFWRTIWESAANAELRARRLTPNVLSCGDEVFVPQRVRREEPVNADRKHRFRRRGEPALLPLRFCRQGAPRAGAAYRVEIDGQVQEGTLDADGMVRIAIPGNARDGRIVVGTGTDRQELALCLGALDPLSTPRGVQQRLRHLGYACPLTGVLDAETRETLLDYQAMNGLPLTGAADAATQRALASAHGS